MERGMDDWDGFYTLAGSTAGTLIGLIFVVITLGIEHIKEGDLRARSRSGQLAQPVSPMS